MRALQLLGYYLDCAFHGCTTGCRAAMGNEPKEDGEQKLLGCIHAGHSEEQHVSNNERIEAPFTVWQVANSILRQAKEMYRDADGAPLLLTKDGWVHYLGGPIIQSWAPAELVNGPLKSSERP